MASCVVLGSRAIFKKPKVKKKKYFKLPLSTLTTISLLDPQIKDYVLQLPRLHAKIIINIRSLSQTYNCDYEN